jgi:hypothetical protein
MAKSQSTLALEKALPSIQSLIPNLRKVGREMKGGCPKCQTGDDRFAIRNDGSWLCRRCHLKGPNQLIDFHKWLYDKTFAQLCEQYGIKRSNSNPVQQKQEQLQIWPQPEEQKPEEQKPNTAAETESPELQKKWDQFQNSQIKIDRFKNYLIDERSIDESVVDQLFTSGELSVGFRYQVPCIMAPYKNLETGIITNIQELSIIDKGKYFQDKLEAGGNSFFHLGPPIATAEKVIFLEGVLDCITAYQFVPRATCIALGAAGYTDKIAKYLKKLIKESAVVYTFFDKDTPGQKAAIKTTMAMGRTTYQVSWPEVEPPGMDINQLLKNQKFQQIIDMLEQVQPLTPEEAREQLPPDDETQRPQIRYTTLAQIGSEKHEDVPIIQGFAHLKDSIMIDGDGGLGKTNLVQHIALAAAAYTPPITAQDKTLLFDTFEIKKAATTIMLQSETPRTFIGLRQQLMAQGNPALKAGAGRVIFPEIKNDVMVVGQQIENPIFRQYITDLLDRVEDDLDAPVDFLIIDPLVSFHGSEENANSEMRRVLDMLWDVLSGRDTILIFTHHDAKNADKKIFRGAQAIWDFARNVIHMEAARIGDYQAIKLENAKCNNRKAFAPIHIIRDKYLNFQLIADTDALSTKQKRRFFDIAGIFIELQEDFMTHKQLSNAYQESSGATPATAKRHIADAVKYKYIIKTPNPDTNSQTQYVYTKG